MKKGKAPTIHNSKIPTDTYNKFEFYKKEICTIFVLITSFMTMMTGIT